LENHHWLYLMNYLSIICNYVLAFMKLHSYEFGDISLCY
jgi:hypothetical protein